MNNKAIAQTLRELAALFDSDESNGTIVRTPPRNAPKGDLEIIEGIVAYPETKKGSKAQFMVWKLIRISNGEEVNCKTFDSALFELVAEGASIICKGNFQEWKGFSSFVVKDIEVNSDKPAQAKESDDSDDVPF